MAAEADEYSCALLDVHLEIWADGAGDLDHNNGFISADQSFVCLDNDDTGGVDVFVSQYGQIGVATRLWQSLPPLPPPVGRSHRCCTISVVAETQSNMGEATLLKSFLI